jgi:hypothetical protein
MKTVSLLLALMLEWSPVDFLEVSSRGPSE